MSSLNGNRARADKQTNKATPEAEPNSTAAEAFCPFREWARCIRRIRFAV